MQASKSLFLGLEDKLAAAAGMRSGARAQRLGAYLSHRTGHAESST